MKLDRDLLGAEVHKAVSRAFAAARVAQHEVRRDGGVAGEMMEAMIEGLKTGPLVVH